MSARVVNFCHTVVMVGLDHHNGLYYLNLFTGQSPGPPVPPMPYPTGLGFSPFTLHVVIHRPRSACTAGVLVR